MTVLRLALGLALATLVLPAPGARAELAPWDQAEATSLASQLAEQCSAVYDSFYKQPTPGGGSGQRQVYMRMKQDVRRLRAEARTLARALEGGAGRDETLPIYEELMQRVRLARDSARELFVGSDVQQKADAARETLNQLTPYYDAEAAPLEPATR